ncbi:hypothetical protein MKX01_020486, partial [Papaver californicum]
GRIVETGSHEELMSKPNSVYSSLVQFQDLANLHRHPSLDSSMGRPLSIKYSRELSLSRTSFGASFRSEKESVNRYVPDRDEPVQLEHATMRRLYAMAAPYWIYGLAGTIGAIIAGAQMPLFALGVTEALVAYYMDWDTTQHEIKKISLLVLGGAIITNEIGWFDETSNNSSMLSSRLEADATLLKTIVVDRFTVLIQNLSLAVTSFIIAFILNWRLTLVVMALYPLLVTSHISEVCFCYGGNLNKAYLKANMLAGEAVSNIRTVAAFCSEEKVIDSLTSLAMGETLAMAPDLIKGNQMAASVFDILDRKTEVVGDTGEEVTKVEGTIEMRRVKFRYPSRANILIFKDFNLKVRAGKSMALVGSSGSGKSSVLALILRFYDATSGMVMIYGKSSLKSLRKYIGLVQQEPALFATSIYKNRLYGKDGATVR